MLTSFKKAGGARPAAVCRCVLKQIKAHRYGSTYEMQIEKPACTYCYIGMTVQAYPAEELHAGRDLFAQQPCFPQGLHSDD